MRKTSRPRTLSRTRTNRFPSENRSVSLAASGQPSSSAILWARRRLADPANNKKSLSTERTYRAADLTRITPLTETAVNAAARRETAGLLAGCPGQCRNDLEAQARERQLPR